jgi:hypothetical protein
MFKTFFFFLLVGGLFIICLNDGKAAEQNYLPEPLWKRMKTLHDQTLWEKLTRAELEAGNQLPEPYKGCEPFGLRAYANLHSCRNDRERVDRITDLLELYLFDSVFIWRPLQEYLDYLAARKSALKAAVLIGLKHRDKNRAKTIPVLPAYRLKFVERNKNHPNVAGWEFCDEIVPGHTPQLKAIVEAVRKVDPSHPLGINLAPYFWCRNKFQINLEQLKDVGEFCDLVSSDAYPIVQYPLWLKREEARALREQVPLGKKIMSVIQVSKYNPDRFLLGSAAPLPEEIRAMVYYALAEGIDELSYWTLGGESKSFGLPYRNMLGDKLLPTARMNEVGIINAEAILLEPFLGRKHWMRSWDDHNAELNIGEFANHEQKLLLLQKNSENEYLTRKSKPVTLQVAVKGKNYKVYRIDFPGVTALKSEQRNGKVSVQIPALSGTMAILVTNDNKLVGWFQNRMAKLLPAVAAMQLRGAAWKFALAEREEQILSKIVEKVPALKTAKKDYEYARTILAQAETLYQQKKLKKAYQKSQEVHLLLNRAFQTLRDYAKRYMLAVIPAERFKEASTIEKLLATRKEKLRGLPQPGKETGSYSLWLFGYHFINGWGYRLDAGTSKLSQIGKLPPKGKSRKWQLAAFTYPLPKVPKDAKNLEILFKFIGKRGPAGAIPGKLLGLYIMPSNLDKYASPELISYGRDWLRSQAKGYLEFGPFINLNMVMQDKLKLEVPLGHGKTVSASQFLRKTLFTGGN